LQNPAAEAYYRHKKRSAQLAWKRTAAALVVELPAARPCADAWVLRITAAAAPAPD
jgi:hypothetical protein